MPPISYQADFAAWALEQAALMRQGRFSEIDFHNLVEEIEDMGKNMHRSLASHMKNLIAHLLKWQYQPQRRSESWRATIARCRSDIPELLEESPSLSADFHDRQWLEKAWKRGVDLAASETGLSRHTFPSEPLWTTVQILDIEFLPD